MLQHHNKLLMKLIRSRTGLYIGSVVALIIASLFAFLVPFIGKVVIDRIIPETNPNAIDQALIEKDIVQRIIDRIGGAPYLQDNLWIAAMAIILVTLLSGLFMYAKDYFSAKACESTVEELRNNLFRHIHLLPARFHTQADSGDLLQRCTSDIDTLHEFLTTQVMNIGRTIILMLIVVPLMLMQDKLMTLVSLVLMPITILFAFVFFNKVKILFLQVDEAEGELTNIVQENLTGIRVVRAFARQEFEIEKFDQANARYRDLNYRLISLLAKFWSTSDFLCLTQMGMVIIGGGWLTSTGHITLGTLFAFVIYTSMIIWPVRELGKELSEAGKAVVAIGRIQEILDEPEEQILDDTNPNLPKIQGNIEFKNIDFGFYPEQQVLHDLSFKVQAGQTVAIVGPTGAGKSTIIQLLLRLYDYESGEILIDGQPLKSFNRQELRKQMGTLLQEPFLFSRSLRENIKFGKSSASEDQMIASSHAAAVHHTIQQFEKGYDTEIGERGVSLSGGQKQRVTLSRTLLKDTSVLILDDTLSAVDSATEQQIIQALNKKKGQQTLLIITHRISVCQQADSILVLQDGRLTDQGDHQQLMSKPGFYQQLWQIQTGQENRFHGETATG